MEVSVWPYNIGDVTPEMSSRSLRLTTRRIESDSKTRQTLGRDHIAAEHFISKFSNPLASRTTRDVCLAVSCCGYKL